MLLEPGAFTAFHIVLSLVALAFGVLAVAGLFSAGLPRFWTRSFLALAAAVSITGFLFPFEGVTPAFGTGIVASIVLLGVFAAPYLGRHARKIHAGKIHAGGIVASLYLLVFVTIAQVFDKTLVLKQTAFAQPAFAVTQGAALIAFVVLGVRAAKKAA